MSGCGETAKGLARDDIKRLKNNSSSIIAKLQKYKHLDDYEYYQKKRSKHNAMKKFIFIMQSVREKHRDCFNNRSTSGDESESHSDTNNYDNDTSDLDEETLVTEFCSFNQILKRHRKRYRLDPSRHHH